MIVLKIVISSNYAPFNFSVKVWAKISETVNQLKSFTVFITSSMFVDVFVIDM